MKIGYASITKGVYKTNFKTISLKNAKEENLFKVIEHNLDTLDRIIDYNIKMDIKMFSVALRNQIPIVYDNLHNELNPFDESKDDKYFIKMGNKKALKRQGVLSSNRIL